MNFSDRLADENRGETLQELCYMEMEESVLCSIIGRENVRPDPLLGEKRRAVRFAVSLPVRLSLVGIQEREARTIVREISACGIGLVSDMTLEPGSEFAIEFPRQDYLPWRALYRTVRCVAASSDARLNLIGALFVGMQSSAPQMASPQSIELDRIRQAVLDW